MKQFIIKFIPFFLLISTSFASNRVNGDKVVFADYQGKMYQVTMQDIEFLNELKNLEEKYIPQTDWNQIISNAEPEIAKSLIEKLASYLPKDELWPYIDTGLLRKENKLMIWLQIQPISIGKYLK